MYPTKQELKAVSPKLVDKYLHVTGWNKGRPDSTGLVHYGNSTKMMPFEDSAVLFFRPDQTNDRSWPYHFKYILKSLADTAEYCYGRCGIREGSTPKDIYNIIVEFGKVTKFFDL